MTGPAASVALELDQWTGRLVDAWPEVGGDSDVVLCAALLSETITQLLRGDRHQAAEIARRVHEVAEQAAEREWPSWTCPRCGDTLNAAERPEHEALHR